MKKKFNLLKGSPSKEQIFHINTDGSLVQTLDFSKNISEFMRGENISSFESSKSAKKMNRNGSKSPFVPA